MNNILSSILSCSSQDHRPRNNTDGDIVGSNGAPADHLNVEGSINLEGSRDNIEGNYDNELKPNSSKHSAPHSHGKITLKVFCFWNGNVLYYWSLVYSYLVLETFYNT